MKLINIQEARQVGYHPAVKIIYDMMAEINVALKPPGRAGRYREHKTRERKINIDHIKHTIEALIDEFGQTNYEFNKMIDGWKDYKWQREWEWTTEYKDKEYAFVVRFNREHKAQIFVEEIT